MVHPERYSGGKNLTEVTYKRKLKEEYTRQINKEAWGGGGRNKILVGVRRLDCKTGGTSQGHQKGNVEILKTTNGFETLNATWIPGIPGEGGQSPVKYRETPVNGGIQKKRKLSEGANT